MKEHEKALMLRAAEEIRALRQANAIQASQLNIVEIFARAMGLGGQSHACGPDTAWLLDRAVVEASDEEQNPAPDEATQVVMLREEEQGDGNLAAGE